MSSLSSCLNWGNQSPLIENILPLMSKTRINIGTKSINWISAADTMDEPTLRRITIEREEDWIRVQQDVDNRLLATMEARLATLPGGKDGPAAKSVRRELEVRIKKVSRACAD